jgi:superfamily II DNA or RNA helicase
MQELRAFTGGRRVEARDQAWTIVGVERFEHVTLLTLRGGGRENVGQLVRLLAPFDRVQPVPSGTSIRRASRRRVLQHTAALLAESPGWLDCWTAASARIELRPWQLEPAKAAIAGTTRLLLADHVGLGKTIQALLVVSELLAHGLARRVLVLTPASLREQWAAEMGERFGLHATVFDSVSLASTLAALPPGVNPWNTAPLIVASIDLVKRAEMRTALDAATFDVLVVDEAHHLTPGSDRAAVVADLASRVVWVVLVTATPHSGDQAAFRLLRQTGDVSNADDLVTYRRAATHLRAAGARRVHVLPVAPTDAERALLQATLAYARAIWNRPGSTDGARLVATVLARRAAASAHAVGHTLRRRLTLIEGERPIGQQAALPWDDEIRDDSESDAVFATPGLDQQAQEIEWLHRLVGLAAAPSPTASKLAVIRRLLTRTREHLIVFSEYRDVIDHVAAQIADLTTVVTVHGGLTPADRRESVRAFNDGRARTLLATDAAGEGLNLQGRCRLVVTLELPWNPLRLEQRIGRVDRLGQTRRVHAIHLVHRGSFEDLVLARLERRRARASADLRDATSRPPEEAIAAAVLADAPLQEPLEVARATHPLDSRPGCPDRSEIERRLRELARGTGARDGHRPLFAPGGHRGRRALVLLFSVELTDRSGRLIQRELIPVRIELPVSATAGRLHKRHLRCLAAEPHVAAAVAAELSVRFARATDAATMSANRLEQRTRTLLSAIDARRHGAVYQASLFDRRAEHRSRALHAAINDWREALAQRENAASALRELTASPPQLAAAWREE